MRSVVLMALLGLILSSCTATRSAAGLAVIPVELGDKTVRVEVAQTPAEMARGLMYRREMDWDKGMLFVYESDQILSFWMKNTFIPLSIAFLDSEGTILHITDMQPQSKTSHRSPGPARYALEMNLGWFEKAGVSVGEQARFELPSP